jgi:hypothetical protein
MHIAIQAPEINLYMVSHVQNPSENHDEAAALHVWSRIKSDRISPQGTRLGRRPPSKKYQTSILASS